MRVMRKRLIAISVMLIVAVVANGATKARKPKLKGKITVEQARAVALAKAPGKIESEELEREEGKLVWSFDIRTSAKIITEVWVDANTGKVLKTEVETAAAEAREKHE
jgi:uncharacterized membrane protein YkoI